jgi:hypothetical protein
MIRLAANRGPYLEEKENAGSAWKPHRKKPRGLFVGLGFLQTDDLVTGFELTAFFEDFDAFEALQNVAFRRNRAGSF